MQSNDFTIPVSFGPAIYATYQRLSYRIDNAIYEFIDNSTQNFFSRKQDLETLGLYEKLQIHINWDPRRKALTIRDNAFGMNQEEFTRAVLLNSPPPDTSGRSEFGMGLKMAACWLSNRWSVTSKQAGATTEYSIDIDVPQLKEANPNSLTVQRRELRNENDHYTRIELKSVIRQIRAPTVRNVKSRIAATYRRDIASGEVEFYWDGEPIEYTNVNREPRMEDYPDGSKEPWEKSLSFNVATSGGPSLAVTGVVWVGIHGSYEKMGIDIFRRGRMIAGAGINSYKPHQIYGSANSGRSLRLGIELDMNDWPVSTNKDAILFGQENAPTEQEFLSELESHITQYMDEANVPGSQREQEGDDRKRPSPEDGRLASDSLKDDFANQNIDTAINIIETTILPDEKDSVNEEKELKSYLENVIESEPIDVIIGSHGTPTFRSYWEPLDPNDVYAKYSQPQDNVVNLIVNTNHPFVTTHIGSDPILMNTYMKTIIADVQVEISLRSRRSDVTAQSFRIMKDLLLRQAERASS